MAKLNTETNSSLSSISPSNATVTKSGAELPEKPPGILAREEAQAELIAALGCRGHGEHGRWRAYLHPGVREWRWVLGDCPECDAGRARPPAPEPSPRPPPRTRELVPDGAPRKMRAGRWRVPLQAEDARRLKVGDVVHVRGREYRIRRLATDGGSTVATVQRLE